ncbi:MAG: DUF2309 family protein [Spirochaetales bacterium]|nr:DUF2309 family protein [Spirochaetales bacterium]
MKSFPECLAEVVPLWGLDEFVAVNPWLGQTHRPFETVLREREEATGLDHLPGQTEKAAVTWHPDRIDTVLGPFLGSYYGTPVVPPPWKELPLWEAWKASLPGSTGWESRRRRALKKLLKELPPSPGAVIKSLGLDALQLLGTLPGWAAYLRRLEWPGSPSESGPLASLAAMLAVLETVSPEPVEKLSQARETWKRRWAGFQVQDEQRGSKFRRLVGPALAENPPQIRAAFCIDVRSEPLRRVWETLDTTVATDGFAGFFGLPLSWSNSADEAPSHHLPVLLTPSIRLKASVSHRHPSKLTTAGTPNFPLVELSGWWHAWRFLFPERPQLVDPYPGLEKGIQALPREEKLSWAETILKNLGWVDRWVPLMLFVGHGSSSVNNPHAAGLDCGACGGQTGEASARAAAALLNDPETRQELQKKNIVIPQTVLFVAAVHDTTTDAVRVFDQEAPESKRSDLEKLKTALKSVQRNTQAERQKLVPFLTRPAPKRARDEAEVRPEAGLAGNSVFIVAPRSATAGKNLEGRAFLHSYAPERDADGSVLELILTAPVVVASWINLQYWGSAVTPRLYGAGNKTLHSRIAQVGVLEGNDYDLKTGLAEQSVGYASTLYHEPARLHVLVTAPLERIDAILKKHTAVAELFDQGWLLLAARDDSGAWKLRRAGVWVHDEAPRDR